MMGRVGGGRAPTAVVLTRHGVAARVPSWRRDALRGCVAAWPRAPLAPVLLGGAGGVSGSVAPGAAPH